jgi:hypothetical protein
MDLNGRRLWQVGAVDTERSYGELCLRHDVMIAGPGDPGQFEEPQYATYGDIKNSLRRFCAEAARGDVVLLRIGTGRILAVGEIADDSPAWSPAFDDVDGWDLRWFPNTAKQFPPTTLGTKARTFAEPVFLKWKGMEASPDRDFFVRSGRARSSSHRRAPRSTYARALSWIPQARLRADWHPITVPMDGPTSANTKAPTTAVAA